MIKRITALPLTGFALLAMSVAGCGATAEQAQEGLIVPSNSRAATDAADADRVKGDRSAPIQLVEISDFECPFCRRFHEETLHQIDTAFIETGRIRYVWVSYANPGHPQAFASSEAAFCAGAVGKFWPMHDLLFENQEEWSSSPDPYEHYVRFAGEIGIDTESFGVCLRNSLLAPLVLRDFTSVNQAGIASTPYFILADSIAIRGAEDFDVFSRAIEEAYQALEDPAATPQP